jgi:hypothetical protein
MSLFCHHGHDTIKDEEISHPCLFVFVLEYVDKHLTLDSSVLIDQRRQQFLGDVWGNNSRFISKQHLRNCYKILTNIVAVNLTFELLLLICKPEIDWLMIQSILVKAIVIMLGKIIMQIMFVNGDSDCLKTLALLCKFNNNNFILYIYIFNQLPTNLPTITIALAKVLFFIS